MNWTPACKQQAKENGLHLIRLEVFGKHAGKGGVQIACHVGPETAKKLWEVVLLLSSVTERAK